MKKIVFLFLIVSGLLSIHNRLLFAEADTVDAYQVPKSTEGQSLLNENKGEEKKPKPPKTQTDELDARRKFNKLSKSTNQIYKVTMRSNVVYHLQTALGYVSTIDLPEPALKVFVGDAELFKVGVYEREILIKPITDYENARTNLTIVTQTGRLTFDVSVGPPGTADFVLDFRLPGEDVLVENAFQKAVEEKKVVLQKHYEEKEKSLDKKAEDLAHEKFKKEVAKGAETILLRQFTEEGHIKVSLISMSTIGEKAYLRFSIRNDSDAVYQISKVVIGAQVYDKKTLGLGKELQGLIEFPSELEITNPVPGNATEYGVVSYDRRAIGKNQYPIFLVFEDSGKRNLRIKSFKWIS